MLGPIIEVGVRMDGLDRLIEMLEKRFGKRWADTLLVIVVLGAAAWAINAFFSYLVVPLIRFSKGALDYFGGAPLTVSAADARLFLEEASVAFVVAVLGFLVIRFLFGRWKKQAAAIEKELTRLLAEVKQDSASLQEEHTRLEQIRVELKAAVQEQIANGKELETLITGTKARLNAKYDLLDQRFEKEEKLLEEAHDVLKEGVAKLRSAPTIPPGDE